MELSRVFEVLRIIFPVFALMGVGKVLRVKNIMDAGNQRFLSDLAYFFALPALIFAELVTQPFGELLNPVVIFGTIIALSLVFILYTAGVLLFRPRRNIASAVIFGSLWANVAYMGFPLISIAFGDDQGLVMAAVVNAISMPLFVTVSFIVMGLFSGREDSGFLNSVKGAVINPVIIAAVLGLFVSWLLSALGYNGVSEKQPPLLLAQIGSAVHTFFKLTGTMGLPLALLAVGGTLSFDSVGKNFLPLSLTIGGKLILLPLVTYFVIQIIFPSAQSTAISVAVVLMATPVAVASSVVSVRYNVEEQFVSSLLAISTALSAVTLPIWLYFLL
ncbi:AEC family transporter [Chitinispirillales bacterium ANBcel5]|uniref:AEC family transporter n=1 Tax=Cellulosispirillum alkaliphilum TaxID=3039283 RepID=UPI002A54F948|nr:AEC family transporter [Chitinispirillales bacterium ANBcel5]